MSKTLMSIIVFLVLLVFFVNGFSASFTSHDITNLAYVLAIGIDVGENAKLKVSAQFSTFDTTAPGSSSSESSGKIILVSGEADSVFSALNLINSYIGKELNLAHCNLIVFSEDYAKKGIATEIYSFINNEEIRPSTNVLISKCTAYNYLDNVKPNSEKLAVQYYDTFSIVNRFTGYFENITIGEFYNKLSSKSASPTAILGGLDVTARVKESSKSSSNKSGSNENSPQNGKSSDENNKSSEDENSSGESSSSEGSGSSNSGSASADVEPSSDTRIITNPEELIAGSSSIEGKLGTENIGIALFDDDRLCGELTAMETICHLLINNSMDSCIISVDDPFKENEKSELNISPKKNSKVCVEIKDGVPHISVKMDIEAYGLTLDKNINYKTHEAVEKLSEITQQYLEEQFNNYFNIISREYGTDIDYFAIKALSNFRTMKEWRDYNWKEKFKNAEFDVSVDVNVVSSLLITKT